MVFQLSHLQEIYYKLTIKCYKQKQIFQFLKLSGFMVFWITAMHCLLSGYLKLTRYMLPPFSWLT